VGTTAIEAPVRSCRSCGCTDDDACAGGCWWVEEDLCSSCADLAPLTCSHCDADVGADVVGLVLPGEDHGFCSEACFVLYARRRWIEATS
jgi:hypothetical protein